MEEKTIDKGIIIAEMIIETEEITKEKTME